MSHTAMKLHEIIEYLDTEPKERVQINLFPPEASEDAFTDEEDENENEINANVNNLPANLLLSEAELIIEHGKCDSDVISNRQYSSEAELIIEHGKRDSDVISNRQYSSKTKNKKYIHWKKDEVIDPSFETWANLITVNNSESPMELFFLFFDDPLIELITKETNRYGARKILSFQEISDNEIRTFIGILLLSGYVVLPCRRMYWEQDVDTHNNLVAKSMSRNRFEFIMSNIHCCNNLELDKKDKYAKVRPIFDKLNTKFLEFAPHEENHSIDEAMIRYFGKHGCKQFMKQKPIRFGFKIWEGATHIGYVTWMEPHQGASTIIEQKYKHLGLGSSVVLSYADHLLSKGYFPYHFFFDNYFTGIALLNELTRRGLRATGTIREHRIPNSCFKRKAEMMKNPRGYYESMCTSDKMVNAVSWNDNKAVTIASNNLNTQPEHSVRRYSQKEKRL